MIRCVPCRDMISAKNGGGSSIRIAGCCTISRNESRRERHPTMHTTEQRGIGPRLASVELCMTIDPVCGMEVEEKTAPASAEYDGEMYYFCSEQCREEFMQDPGEFIGLAA